MRMPSWLIVLCRALSWPFEMESVLRDRIRRWQGAHAFRRGRAISKNRLPPHTEAWRSWRSGYLQAQSSAEGAMATKSDDG